MGIRGRLTVAVAVASATLASASVAAASQSAALVDAAPLLPGGATLGTFSGIEGVTEAHTGSGPCAGGAGTARAAVYRVDASVRSLLDLDVSDDRAESPSLCRVALYDAAALGDLFDASQRDAARIASSDACAAAAACGFEVWLNSGQGAYAVLWALDAEAGAPPAEFAYTVRLRRAASTIRLSVAGHRLAHAGWHEVVTGRYATLTAAAPHAGRVALRVEKGGTAGWSLLATYTRTLSSGAASARLLAGSPGTRRIVADYLGDATTLPRRSASVLLRFVRIAGARYADGGLRLSVPWYHQEHRLTCESAALRMALRYFGRSMRDLDILRVIGVDARQPSGGRWGNPWTHFVGRYDGYMVRTGYGVYSPPVARAATSLRGGRPALRFSNWSWAKVAAAIDDGFPVILWGAHAGPSGVRRVTWRAWDGAWIEAYSVQHTWTLVGFRGPASKPTHFVVHDPSGAQGATRSVYEVARFAAPFHRMGVVVR